MWTANNLLKDARNGNFVIDCLEMELKGNAPERPVCFRGPGYIKQGTRGLEFKLYAKELENVDMRAKSKTKEGEVIQHSHLYSLFARDDSGNHWTSSRIAPHFCSPIQPNPSSIVVDGSIFELECRRELDFIHPLNRLRLAIYENITVPFNTSTDYFKSERNEEPELSRSVWDHTNFQAAGCNFTVNNEDGILLLSAESVGPFPELLEARLIEALLFVVGKHFWWRELWQITGQNEILRLRSYVISPTPIRMRAPFYERFDSIYKNYWHLFSLYLEFVVKHDQHDFHPCSALLSTASQGSSNSAYGYALTLAVAVESLVKYLHSDLGVKDLRYKNAVDAFKDYVMSWPQLDQWVNEGGPNRERLIKLPDTLNQVSPQDRLYLLAKKGVLIEGHVDTWKKLRTRTAHVLDDPNSPELQKLLRQIDTVIVLMYHLLFHAIGYQGPYVDFSTVG